MRLDCIGLLSCAYRQAGLTVFDRTNYGVVPTERELTRALHQHFGRIRGKIRDGDALLFWIPERRRPIHCGIADGKGFWHVEHGGVVCWVALRGHWRDDLRGIYGMRD